MALPSEDNLKASTRAEKENGTTMWEEMTMNGTQPSSCSSNPTAEKRWRNLCLLPAFCFAGSRPRHWRNCLQDEKHAKTHQLCNRKHGCA